MISRSGIAFASSWRSNLPHAASRRRKQLLGLAGEPVGDEPDPLVHGSIGTRQALAQRTGKTCRVERATGAPIDRTGCHGKAGGAERRDGARHVKRRVTSNQRSPGFGCATRREYTAFSMVL